MDGSSLIMELTLEQGPGRETQVQPPLDVWVRYFRIDLEDEEGLPTLVLHGAGGGAAENRPVVFHDHNWTIEIAQAGPPRPAILWMKRLDELEHRYAVLRPGDQDYDRVEWMLHTFPNPHRKKGRRWLVI